MFSNFDKMNKKEKKDKDKEKEKKETRYQTSNGYNKQYMEARKKEVREQQRQK